MIGFVCFIFLSGNGLAYRWMTTLSLLLSDFAGAAGYTVSIVLPQSSAACQRNPSQNPFTQQQHTSVTMYPPLSVTGRDEWGSEGHFLLPYFKLRSFKTNRVPPGDFLKKLSCTSTFPVWQDSLSQQHTLCSALFYLCCPVWLWAKRLCNPYNFLQNYAIPLTLKGIDNFHP